MRSTVVRVVAFLSLLFAVSALAFGQAETGLITGTVTDPSGAIVAGAKVTITDVNTGASRTSTTNNAGSYTFTNLKPDTYDVVVEGAGFAKFTRRVDVTVGSHNEVSAAMSVTGGGTTVEVTAEGGAAQVNTESQTLSTVVTSKQITELPTLTRNPYDLVATSGNVSDADASARGAGVSINGQRSASTDILLDGGENVDLYTATVGQNVPLDSVQEFRVVTSDFTAEYGRAGGGVVNVSTKSGTNSFHGTAYEFNRVSALAANTWYNDAFSIPKGTFTRNQFGYSVGGPIIKNKLFFFSSTEWTRVRSTNNNIADVIDPAFLADASVSPNTAAFFSTYGTLKPSVQVLNVIPWGSGTDPNGIPHTPGVGPAPGTPALDKIAYGINGDAGGGAPQNTYSSSNRIDLNLTDRTTLFARYAVEHQLLFPGTISFSPYVGYDTPDKLFRNNILINMTHVFSPNFVSQSKVVYNRLNESQPFGSAPVGPTLYTNYFGLESIQSGDVLFPGYSPTTPGNSIPYGGPQNLYQFYQDLSWTHGKHQFRFGGQYIHTRDNRTFGAYEGATGYLNKSGNLGDAFDQLVYGNIERFQVAVDPQGKYPCPIDPTSPTGDLVPSDACSLTTPVAAPSFTRHNHYNDFAAYMQDTWKVTPRLTLNLGVRWEYYGVQHNDDPSLDSNFYLGTGDGILQQLRNGSVQVAPQSPLGQLWASDYNNIAPRVGFAYDVFGDGKTSIRGGYGISYERNFGNVTYNVIQNPPATYVTNLQNTGYAPGSSLNIPIPVDNFGFLAGSSATPIPMKPGSLRAVSQNIPTAYTEQWSFSLEREVMKNSVLAFEYSGAHGVHLYDISNVSGPGQGYAFFNDANLATGTNLQYSAINLRSARGQSKYNGLNTRFTTNNLFNLGLQLNFNWTWAHSQDDLSSAFSEGGNGNFQLGYIHAFDPAMDFGNSEYDIRHRFVVSGVWDVPWGKKSSSGIVREALGGWSISPIFTYRTGAPYSIYDCTNAFFNCGRWIPGAPTQLTGSANASTAVVDPTTGMFTGVFNYMQLPVDSATGAAAGAGASWGDLPINPATFTSTCPTPGSLIGCDFGPNVGRNQFRGPGNHQFNLVVAKAFKLTEHMDLQFRGEAYNVLNNHNYYLLTQNLDVSGGITAVQAMKGGYGNVTDERRNLQFGLKLIF